MSSNNKKYQNLDSGRSSVSSSTNQTDMSVANLSIDTVKDKTNSVTVKIKMMNNQEKEVSVDLDDSSYTVLQLKQQVMFRLQ